jgi:hypothetical protein
VKSVALFTEYTDEYKEKCKQAWYAVGRPKNAKLWLDATPIDDLGRKPNAILLRKWRSERMWDFWADDMDSRAIAIVEDTLITQKAQMLQRQADMAWKLQDKGIAYLEAEGFDNSSSAVQAIIRGAELERTSRGIGEMIVKMASMGDTELKDEIVKMINRASENDQIIDMDEVPEKKEEENESV